MRKQSWTKRDPIKNYFPLPNEIYDLKLSRGAIAVYSYLLRREQDVSVSAQLSGDRRKCRDVRDNSAKICC